MNWRIRTAALAAAGAMLTSAAAAAAPSERFVTFNVMGDDVRTPIPDGLCEVRDRYVALAQMLAAGDEQNLTFMTLYDCAAMDRGESSANYILIKAPRTSLRVKVERPELLEAMGAIPPSELAAVLDGDTIDASANKSLNEVLGLEGEIKSNIQPVDRDTSGYYLAGVLKMQVDEQAHTSVVAVAITSIKGHVLSYNVYNDGDKPADIAAVLNRAKTGLSGWIAANPTAP